MGWYLDDYLFKVSNRDTRAMTIDVQYINSIHTNIYTIYLYINSLTCV